MMETCNACGKLKRDPRYRACEKCRAGWRVDKGLTYQKKTVPIEQHRRAIGAVMILLKALRDIRSIDLGDCEKYVRKADDIACNALAEYESMKA